MFVSLTVTLSGSCPSSPATLPMYFCRVAIDYSRNRQYKIPFERRIGCYIVRRLSLIILCGTSSYQSRTPRHFYFDVLLLLWSFVPPHIAAYSPSRKIKASRTSFVFRWSSQAVRRVLARVTENRLVCGFLCTCSASTVSCSLYRNPVLCDVIVPLYLYAVTPSSVTGLPFYVTIYNIIVVTRSSRVGSKKDTAVIIHYITTFDWGRGTSIIFISLYLLYIFH